MNLRVARPHLLLGRAQLQLQLSWLLCRRSLPKRSGEEGVLGSGLQYGLKELYSRMIYILGGYIRW